MVFASASDPIYFDAASLTYTIEDGKDETAPFIGGGSVAENPAMYAYLLASDLLGINTSKITMTTIGAEKF